MVTELNGNKQQLMLLCLISISLCIIPLAPRIQFSEGIPEISPQFQEKPQENNIDFDFTFFLQMSNPTFPFSFARRMNREVFFGESSFVFLASSDPNDDIIVTYFGANQVLPTGFEKSEKEIHHIGSQSQNLNVFESIVYKDLYKNIDLVFSTLNGDLKYYFRVKPGGNSSEIQFRITNSDAGNGINTKLNSGDSLSVYLNEREIFRDEGLCAWYEPSMAQIPITFKITSQNTISFIVEMNLPNETLVIDPTIYSTYLGGTSNDKSLTLDIDESGMAYIGGETSSPDFNITTGDFLKYYEDVNDLYVSQSKLYSVDKSSLTVFDISKPQSPSLFLNVTGYGEYLKIMNEWERIYVVNNTHIAIFSVYNYDEIALLKDLALPFSIQPYEIVAKDNHLYIACDFGLFDIDLLNIEAPQISRPYTEGLIRDIEFIDEELFAINSTSILIFDSSEVDENSKYLIQNVSTIADLVNPLTSISVSTAEIALVSREQNSYFIFDVSNITSPEKLGEHSETGSFIDTVALQDFFVILDSNSRLFSINATNASTPEVADFLITGKIASALGCVLFRTDLFVFSEEGFLTVTTTDPSNLRLIGCLSKILHGSEDGFICKLNLIRKEIVFATYLGGSGFDSIQALKVDSLRYIYVAGITSSGDFPTPTGTISTNGNQDVFICKLNEFGSELVYTTLLGGEDNDYLGDMVIDKRGGVYCAGWTDSENFPLVSPINSTFTQDNTIFISMFDENGDSIFSSYYGPGKATAIEIDSARNLYISGVARYDSEFIFTTTSGVIQENFASNSYDGFILKLGYSTGISFCTLLGGSNDDNINDIDVTNDGLCYIAGKTLSPDFPLKYPIYPTLLDIDSFIAVIGAGGNEIIFSSFLGGEDQDEATAIEVDAGGCIFIGGTTRSPNFPVTPDGETLVLSGGIDTFLCKLNFNSHTLEYSTYFGGLNDDSVQDIEIDDSGILFSTGFTISSDLMLKGKYFQSQPSGSNDIFVTKFDFENEPPTISPSSEYIIYEERAVGNEINWSIEDNWTTAASYSIKLLSKSLKTGSWFNGSTIILNVDGLSPGEYPFKLEANDGMGKKTTSFIYVVVNPLAWYKTDTFFLCLEILGVLGLSYLGFVIGRKIYYSDKSANRASKRLEALFEKLEKEGNRQPGDENNGQ